MKLKRNPITGKPDLIGGTPDAHATTHQEGGSDPIKLDDLATPDDNTDLNASVSAHGLLLKLDNNTSNFLRGDGTWSAPAAGAVSDAKIFFMGIM